MADIIIKGGEVITTQGMIKEGVVVVEDGLISFVGKHTKERGEVIDAKGCAVLPGLINAHTHISMTLFRGFAENLGYNQWIEKIQQAEKKLTPNDIKAGAYLGVLEMIKTGTTCFADMYIHMDEVAQVVEKTGMRAALGYGIIESEDIEAKLKHRAEFVKRWNNKAEGRITAMYAPHSAITCSKELLIKLKELSHRDHARIHIHVLETKEERHLMKTKYNMSTISLLNSINFLDSDVLLAHCTCVSNNDMNILKDTKVNVVHCPTSNMVLGTGRAPVVEMMKKGINVAIGTDSVASGWNLNMWKEMCNASLLHPKLLLDVLEMATVNAAKALNINAGELKTGKLADIILVDLKKPYFLSHNLSSALVHGAYDVKTTIVGGKVLMQDYEVKVIDEEKVVKDAKESMLNINSNH